MPDWKELLMQAIEANEDFDFEIFDDEDRKEVWDAFQKRMEEQGIFPAFTT